MFDFWRLVYGLFVPVARRTSTFLVSFLTVSVRSRQNRQPPSIPTSTGAIAIEELAGVTILCSDKAGTLTVDKTLIKTYGSFSLADVLLLAAYASRLENQDAVDTCVMGSLDDRTKSRAGVKLVDFKPSNPVEVRRDHLPQGVIWYAQARHQGHDWQDHRTLQPQQQHR